VDLSGQLNLGASFTDVPGGTAHWIFTGGTNYTDQSGDVAVVINQAVADVNVTGYTGTYDAAAHGATGSATGVGGVDLSGQLNLGVSFTDVPGGTAHWAFTGGTNYTDQSGDVAIVINQAVAEVSVTGYTGTYDAQAHGASGSATGVGGVNLSGQLNLGATFTDVPGGTAHWTFSGGTNYTDQSGDAPIVINQAVANVNVTGYAGTYDAAAHGATGSATGVGGVNLSGQLNLGATFTDVPGGTAHWTFTGGTNYTDQSGDVAVVITVRALSVSGVTANNKPFDGNASATLNFGAAGLVGVIAPDAVTLYTGSATGTFASSAVGSWTVTVAGLTIGGTDSGNYRLIQPTTTAAITAWKLSGFFQPVGIPNTSEGAPLAPTNGVWNTIKGGQTVPLKFELFTSAGGTELTSVSDVTGFVVTGAVCSAGPEDWVENTLATTGGTTLRYADGQFIVNWVTPKGANNCYRVTMTARDGSQLSAFFKTK
jgi:hypothetical protein